MNPFKITKEEREKILEKHKEATKRFYQKKEEMKEGLKKENKTPKEK